MLLDGLTALDQVVDAEQNESSHERHKESCGLVGLIVANETAEICPQEGAGYAYKHRDKDATWLFTWDDEFGDGADNKTDKSRPKQMKHGCSSVFVFSGITGSDSIVGESILQLEIDASI